MSHFTLTPALLPYLCLYVNKIAHLAPNKHLSSLFNGSVIHSISECLLPIIRRLSTFRPLFKLFLHHEALLTSLVVTALSTAVV